MTVKEAYKKITSSPELKKAAIEAVKNGKAEEFLKEQGIDLTLNQIKDYFENKHDELSKEELNMAAGGGGGFGDCGDNGCNRTIEDVIFSIGSLIFGCIVSAVDGPQAGNKAYCGFPDK